MHNPILVKSFLASGAIAAMRAVKISAAGTVAQASAASDAVIGVSDRLAAASGEPVDVVLSGIAEVQAGAAITVGALVTVDSNGKVVTATLADTFAAGTYPVLTPGAFPTLSEGALTGGTLPSLSAGTAPSYTAATDRVLGIALEAATADGDIIPVLLK